MFFEFFVTILIIWFLKGYIHLLWTLRHFVTPGICLPLIGHSYRGIFITPEKLLPISLVFAGKDPQWRKTAAAAGTHMAIILFHPETTEKLLTSNNINKSFLYDPIKPWLGQGILTEGGARWKNQRKMLAPSFHYKILEDSVHVFNKDADILIDILLKDGDHGSRVLDVYPYIVRCTLDVILEATMGRDLEIQNQRECQYSRSIAGMLNVVQYRQKSPWIWNNWVFSWTKTKRLQDKYLKVLHKFSREVIQEEQMILKHSGSPIQSRKRMAFLDLLMSTKNENGQSMSEQEIQQEVDTFMFAGHDTTACAISWTLLLLANHPEAQGKVRKEQEEIFCESDDKFRDVTQPDLTKMNYLECCIKETLRLYPSVPILGREIDEDLWIDGKLVPRGSTALIQVYVQHRNPSVWKFPDKFIPERFMPENQYSTQASQHSFAYIPFSAGSRNCIGMKFAMMEAKTLLSKIFRRLKVERYDSVEDVKYIGEIVTKPTSGIRAYFKEDL